MNANGYGISTYADSYSTYHSGQPKTGGLVDYPNGSINYMLVNESLNLSNATISFANNNFYWDPADHMVYYNTDAGNWGSGKSMPGTQFTVTFQNAALGSDGAWHDVVMSFSNVYLYHYEGKTKKVGILEDKNGSLWMASSLESTGVFYDVTVSVSGASASDSLFMMFADLDVGWQTKTSGYKYTGTFGENKPIEAVKIMSGIYPGTQPHVPSDCILRIVDGPQPEYYATKSVSGDESYTAAMSYMATATGTTYRWSGQGCGTAVGVSMGSLPSFSIKTQVRTELDSSPVTGTKSYEEYYDVDYKQFMGLMQHDYSYTYSKDALFAAKGLTAPGDDWIFDFTGATVGETGVTSDRVYQITINRNRYTYSFKPNPPAGKTASDISGMPSDKTVTASKSTSGKSDATVNEPSLTGFWFKGWNTKADGTGTSYPGSETMKSDKVFYAQWQPATYVVHFNANGSVNPNHQTGEFTQNTTTGTMTDQTLHFDQTENLKANAYAREGYTFAGWNTKSDGTGTSYTDKQAVRNLIGYDRSEITLYAQWTKKLGTETITIVSEETGNPVSGVAMTLQKNVNGTWTNVTSGTTNAQGKISVSDLHWFKYQWVMTSVPTGYVKSANTAFTITYNQLSATNQVVLYMKHVRVILDSQVSDIIKGETAPAFLYTVSGKDVAGVTHTYHVLVQTNAGSKFGTNRVPDLFAGTYTVTQTPVSRYNAGTAVNVSHSTISGIHATVDVKNYDSAEVKFPYTIKEYGWYYGVNSRTNGLRK